MEQKSDVAYRAEKLYKNSREKFGYLIREIVSNSIHSTIIRKANEKSLEPNIELDITIADDNIKIILKDNGEGFNEDNSVYFTHLDKRNPKKVELNFHPMGQGRLSIVYFADRAYYNSIFKLPTGEFREKNFNYPEEEELSLFNIEDNLGMETIKNKLETTLTLEMTKQQSYGRAKTFFNKYDSCDKLRNWFIKNFFPFFMEIDSLQLFININGDICTINRKYIEKNINSIDFSLNIEDSEVNFILWLIEKEEVSRSKNVITCYARHLKAEIEGTKLEYEIDLEQGYEWCLTSDYFDNNVDQKGDKIEISTDNIEKIQKKLYDILNEYFKSEINQNREKSKKNYKKTEKKYKSLSPFMNKDKVSSTNKVLNESDIVTSAIEYKGKTEKNYWLNDNKDEEDVEKLINSSLQIYVNHRKAILEKLKDLIRKFDDHGDNKRVLEDEVHDIFLKRGESLKNSDNINHLHNLWILDDKYTIFTETKKSKSTNRGQEASDIYLWSDDIDKTKELLILELKSTTHAHNSGNKYESMVAQVKRYATDFYNNPERIVNWNVDTDRVLYTGIILSRKGDINRELNSNNLPATANKIPFLENSYFFNTKFSVSRNSTSRPQYVDIRIEMYAYEDILYLALDRNEVFFKLLECEFKIEEEI